MIITIPDSERRYIPQRDRDLDAADQTAFILRTLTERDRVRIMDTIRVSVGDDGGGSVGGSGTRVYETVKAGIAGWDNLKTPKGAEVAPEFDADGRIADTSLAILPWDLKQELQEAVLGGTLLDEEDTGK